MSQQHYPQSHKLSEMKHFLDDRVFQGIGGLLQMTLSPVIRHNFIEYGEITRRFNEHFTMLNAQAGIGETGLKRFQIEEEKNGGSGGKSSLAPFTGMGGDMEGKRKISFFDMINDMSADPGEVRTGPPVERQPESNARLDILQEMKDEMAGMAEKELKSEDVEEKENQHRGEGMKGLKQKMMKSVTKKVGSIGKTKANVLDTEGSVDADII
eukprot:765907-Hanusia_phi.AAC.1